VKTFIYCSSVSALGDFYESQPVGEDYPLRPNSTYGASKAAMDMVLRGLWGRIPMDLCSLRFTAIYGPRRRTVFLVETIISAALAGHVARIGPMTDWPYIYIERRRLLSQPALPKVAGSSATSLRIRKE